LNGPNAAASKAPTLIRHWFDGDCDEKAGLIYVSLLSSGGSVAEWLACWTQAQKGLGSNRSRYTLSGNSLRQTVHTHCASVHQTAKKVAAFLRAAG